MGFSSPHWQTCLRKRQERHDRIASLPDPYHTPFTSQDHDIVSSSVGDIVSNVQKEIWSPLSVLVSFGKKALRAHARTNCITEILIPDAETWAKNCNKKGPLAGVPVSLKDSCAVEGYDSTIGYSVWAGKPLPKDSPLVRLLKDAGAVPFVKTAVPITLMSFESTSDVFGICKNPIKPTHSPGGSSGGESALLAYGGSRIGIGTDVAGSVRIPAHFSGIYSIKSSTGRFPKPGPTTSMPGQEGVPSICAPMARTLEDLETFWKAVVGMKPWEYDHTCHPISWRDITLPSKVKWGVMWDDGVVTPSPACKRALNMVVNALKAAGHEIVTFEPPSPYEGILIGSQLIMADGGRTMMKPFRWFEHNDRGAAKLVSLFGVPLFVKKLYALALRYLFRDPITAGLIENFHEKTVEQTWALNARREAYKAKWFEAWKTAELDFLLTVPNACPAVPHGGMATSVASCGYTFLFNIIDYTAGVLPVTHVDAAQDSLPTNFKAANAIENGAYKQYVVRRMEHLPVGVQIVGRRLEEEKVIEGMKAVQEALKVQGQEYKQLEVAEI